MGGWAPGAPTLANRAASMAQPVASCCDGAPAIITFTSGTTGAARAVARSHGFLRAQHSAIADSLRLTPGDVDLTTLPIFLLANLASGVTSIIPDADLRAPGRIDPLPVLDQIRSERPTRTVASPALLEQLASGAARSGQPLGTLRKVFPGGAPVFPRTLDALAAIAPNASITAVYGSTEAEPIASIRRSEICSADRLAMQQGAGVLVGRPAPSIRVRILPDRWGTPIPSLAPSAFERDTLPVRRAGEIVVSGGHVVPGYLDGEGDEETKILVGGQIWHRTGDAGYVDGEGRLWLLGRCSARVADGGGVLYPLAVECAASRVSGVRRSAFLRHRGRRVLVVETDQTDAFPRRSLLHQLAWAHLEEVITIRRIPVDGRHNAKIDLAALRDTLA
jgi:acyl-CoA synthetase (AMP-forming)/AMP-acid ligase II